MIDLVLWSFVTALAPLAVGLAWKMVLWPLRRIALECSRAFEGTGQAASRPLGLDSPSGSVSVAGRTPYQATARVARGIGDRVGGLSSGR